MRIAALVPVKHLDRAKKRLDGVLTPDQRRGLVIAMLKDVLAVLTGHRGLDAVHVVTPDETVAAIARQFGARVIDEPPGGGLNAALRHAAERLGGDGFVLDQVDADQASEIEAMGMAVLTTNTIMKTLEDRIKLAEQAIEFAKQVKVENQ